MGLKRNVPLGTGLRYQGKGGQLSFVLHRIGGDEVRRCDERVAVVDLDPSEPYQERLRRTLGDAAATEALAAAKGR